MAAAVFGWSPHFNLRSMKDEKIKVALLVRVSSKSERQDYSRQIADLTALCAEKYWQIHTIIKAKISATKTRIAFRDDVKELMEVAESGKIDKVVVTELTRIGRKADEISETVRKLRSLNVSVYIQSIALDTNSKNPMQKAYTNIIITVMGEYAEMEMLRLSDRIKSGMRAAKSKGKRIGRKPGVKEDFAEKMKKNKKYREVAKFLKDDWSVRKTAEFTKVSASTVQKIKKYLHDKK